MLSGRMSGAACLLLCWSLAKLNRVRSAHHVAIVGGGVSGMTCAVALAVWTGCLPAIFHQTALSCRAAASAVSSGRVLKAIAVPGAAL